MTRFKMPQFHYAPIIGATYVSVAAIIGLITLLTAIIGFFWLALPISLDQMVFFASARQADFLGAFPFNVYQSWEIKPLGNKIIVYSIYRATTLFVDFSDKANFVLVARLIYGLVILAVSSAFIASIRGYLKEYKINPILALAVVLFAFYSLSLWSSLQTEGFSLLIFIAAVPLALGNSKALNLFSGFMLATLLLTKGVTILIPFQLFVILYASTNYPRSKLRRIFVGFTVSILLIAGVILVAFPQEITDIRNATLLQGSFENYGNLDRLQGILKHLPNALKHVPLLLPGIVLAWLVSFILLRLRRWEPLIQMMIIWALSVVVVLIQGKFFAYHYVVFLIPTAYSAFLFYQNTIEAYENDRRFVVTVSLVSVSALALVTGTWFLGFGNFLTLLFLFGAAGLIGLSSLLRYYQFPLHLYSSAVIFLIIIISSTSWIRYVSPWGSQLNSSNETDLLESTFQGFDSKYQLSSPEKLLFLAHGSAAYFLEAPTYCRHFDPLPLHRIQWRSKDSIENSGLYRETLDCILSYKGQYIVHSQNLLPLELYPDIAKKIETEYEVVDSSDDARILKRR